MTRFLFIACGLTVLAAIGIGLAVSLRRSPAVQATGDEPLPGEQAPWPDDVYEILSIVMCTRCSEEPSGTCTCGIACPHPACVFDQAVLTGLNRDELDFLRGEREMPEKRDAL